MFILANFLHSIATLMDILLSLYMWVVIIQALLSWVNPDPYNPIVRFLHNITEPVFYRVRRLLPLHFGGIDLSPMIIILLIIFVKSFVVQTLHQLAYRIG